ncbi:addiction module antidote protein [Trueperella pyogenes]|uniref:addiction module antidote protein n=1 Tax=Trueperella pyogenes TaxID=1661 RepID=UPI003DAA31EA
MKPKEDIAAYLNAALEEGDPALLQVALGDVAKARGVTAIAREAGVGRESLYKSLSENGNPSWQTITKVLTALGLKIEVKAIALA